MNNIIIEISPSILHTILIVLVFITILTLLIILSVKSYKINKNKIELTGTIEAKHHIKELKLHFIYISIILTLFIIILFTCLFAHIESMESKISFASTISSIILSILAIFMSIIGESKSERLQIKIEDSSEKIEDTVGKLNDNIDLILTKLDESINSTNKLSKQIDDRNIDWNK